MENAEWITHEVKHIIHHFRLKFVISIYIIEHLVNQVG
jgi:hypothetical protein